MKRRIRHVVTIGLASAALTVAAPALGMPLASQVAPIQAVEGSSNSSAAGPIPPIHRYTQVTLKRALETVDIDIDGLSGGSVSVDSGSSVTPRYHLFDAWPSKVVGPDFEVPIGDVVVVEVSVEENARPPQSGQKGTSVKWFNDDKGFGFIANESGEELAVTLGSARDGGTEVEVEGESLFGNFNFLLEVSGTEY